MSDPRTTLVALLLIHCFADLCSLNSILRVKFCVIKFDEKWVPDSDFITQTLEEIIEVS